MNKNKNILVESEKKLGLVCVGLFFMLAVIGIKTLENEVYAISDAVTAETAIRSARAMTLADRPSASNYDIAAGFLKTDFDYDPSSTTIFGNVAEDNQVYYGKLNGANDKNFTVTNRYCLYDGKNHDYPNGWAIERRFLSTTKYEILVNGSSKEDCGLGSQPQNAGWFKLNPDSGWNITQEVSCTVTGSRGEIIDTYCMINRETGEVKWRAGSMCVGCCACGDGAVVAIDIIVEKASADATETVKPTAPNVKVTEGAFLTASIIPNDAAKVAKGAKEAQLIAVQLTNTGTEDLTLSGIGFKGIFKKSAVENPVLYAGDVKLGTPDNTRVNEVTYGKLSVGIGSGKTVTLTLKGNIPEKVKANFLDFRIDSSHEIFVAKSVVSQKSAKITINGKKSVLNLKEKTQSDNTGISEISQKPNTDATTGNIKDGSLIQTKGDNDVYIIKIANGKMFKRLILNPSVFKSYKHLKWENIIAVDKAKLDSYLTSDCVRVTGNDKVWILKPAGDAGMKEDANSSDSKCDLDGIYEINANDFASYK